MTQAKILELKEQADKIQRKIAELEQKRNEGYAKLLSKMDLGIIQEEEFVGALLYIKEQMANDDIKGKWLEAGRKFLKRKPKP